MGEWSRCCCASPAWALCSAALSACYAPAAIELPAGTARTTLLAQVSSERVSLVVLGDGALPLTVAEGAELYALLYPDDPAALGLPERGEVPSEVDQGRPLPEPATLLLFRGDGWQESMLGPALQAVRIPQGDLGACLARGGCLDPPRPDEFRCNLACMPQPPQPPLPPEPAWQSCPAGWRRGPEERIGESVAQGCLPPVVDAYPCPSGQVPSLRGAGCRPLGRSCPPGEWPEQLPPGESPIYVRSEGPAGGTGSEARPYGSLEEAARSLRGGELLVLGRGRHLAPSAPLDAHLLGACTASTSISGTLRAGQRLRLEALEVNGATGSAVEVPGGARLELRDARLRSRSVALVLEPTATASLARALIDGPAAVMAVNAAQGSALSLDDVAIVVEGNATAVRLDLSCTATIGALWVQGGFNAISAYAGTRLAVQGMAAWGVGGNVVSAEGAAVELHQLVAVADRDSGLGNGAMSFDRPASLRIDRYYAAIDTPFALSALQGTGPVRWSDVLLRTGYAVAQHLPELHVERLLVRGDFAGLAVSDVRAFSASDLMVSTLHSPALQVDESASIRLERAEIRGGEGECVKMQNTSGPSVMSDLRVHASPGAAVRLASSAGTLRRIHIDGTPTVAVHTSGNFQQYTLSDLRLLARADPQAPRGPIGVRCEEGAVATVQRFELRLDHPVDGSFGARVESALNLSDGIIAGYQTGASVPNAYDLSAISERVDYATERPFLFFEP